MEKDLLAYCGLFCGDCAGHAGEIADAATELARVLDRYQFHRTARALFAEEVGDYEDFRATLSFMTDLRCPNPCRARSHEETNCQIRACAIAKGLYACHACDRFETCRKLKTMEELHGESCILNLRGIRKMGLERWLTEGERLWFGRESDG